MSTVKKQKTDTATKPKQFPANAQNDNRPATPDAPTTDRTDIERGSEGDQRLNMNSADPQSGASDAIREVPLQNDTPKQYPESAR